MAERLEQHLVGAHVRRARLQRGMTLRMLAREAGFSPSFMSQVENGQVALDRLDGEGLRPGGGGGKHP